MTNASAQFSPFAVPANFPQASPKIGALIGPFDVELAVLQTLNAYLVGYLGQIELDRNIPYGTLKRPPGPESYRGAVDGTPFQEDELPTLVVSVTPEGAPERSASAGYSQTFTCTVHCIVAEQSEDESRQLASYYATAALGAVGQQGALGGITIETRVAMMPTVNFPIPDDRRLAEGVVSFDVFVQPVFDDQYSGTFLSAPFPPPPYGSWPIVTTVNLTVESIAALVNMTSGDATITCTTPFPPSVSDGVEISGGGIPQGTTVVSFNSPNITMSADAEQTAQAVAIFLGSTVP